MLRSRYCYFRKAGEMIPLGALSPEPCALEGWTDTGGELGFVPLPVTMRMTYLGNRYSNYFAGECNRGSFHYPKMLESLIKDGSYVFACGDFLVLDFVV